MRKLPKAVKFEEFQKLIKVIPDKDKVSKVAFLLAFGSGLRISEIVGGKREDGNDILPLKPEQIDLNRNIIELRDAKYGVDRTVPLPKGWKQYMDKLLPIKKSPRTLQRKFKDYAKKANLPPYYTFHSLRHGFAIRLAEEGVPLNYIQALLGHSNLSTTSIYTRARPEDALKQYWEKF